MSRINNSRDLHTFPHTVGAVASLAALRLAARLTPQHVDFLEIRVDAFAADPAPLLRTLPRLRVPLIITVRHPAEGGLGALSVSRRRALFATFLPFATCLDVELRSFDQLAPVIAAARAGGVKIIASTHYFHTIPSAARLRQTIRRARQARADVCKIAALTETPRALGILLGLFDRTAPLPLSVMGMGALGKISRLLLAQAGSVLNYGYLHQPNASGQWEAVTLKKRLVELFDSGGSA